MHWTEEQTNSHLNEIFKKTNDYENITGYVYFLLQDKEIVYVGTTENLNGRIKAHRQSIKVFNKVKFFEISEKDRFIFEFLFIKYYKPKYNKVDRPPNGFGTLKDLKKPLYKKTYQLEKWVSNKNISFIEFCGEKYYWQEDIVNLWESEFGYY